MATTALAQRAPSRRFLSRYAGYVLVLPAVIYVLALVGFPLILGVWYSLTDVTVAREGQYIGLRNFVDATKDPTFRLAVRNTLIVAVVSTFAKITRIVRALFVLPWTVPIALSTISWKWMFHSQYSVINWLLLKIGIIDQNIQWLGTPVAAMAAVILVSTWRAVPFGAIVVLAGLTAVPSDVVDAARIDGANWWARFQKVIVPIIAPILFIAVLFDLIFTLTELTVVYLLTGGGPVDQTQVMANYALQVGISGSQLGSGAAIALFLLPAQLLLTVLVLRSIARREGL